MIKEEERGKIFRMYDFLLSIAIPTYNRASYLDQCLQHLCDQLRGNENYVELLVCDNNSGDDTAMIVQKHISNGNAIKYVKNSSNIGPDHNIAQCFDRANGKYVWIFGDDDILLEGALGKVLKILRDDEYGVVHINTYGFKCDYRVEKPWQWVKNTLVYTNPYDFFKRVNYWVTFITANIINKSFYDSTIDRKTFLKSNLVQLSWTFSAILRAQRNIVINEYLIAAKAQNSGGYGLCNVFGQNLNALMRYFEPCGMRIEFIHLINNALLLTFFPGLILLTRDNHQSFHEESFYKQLFCIFNKYFLFWLIVVPISVLPIKIAWLWYLPIRIFNKLNRLRTA